MWSYKRGQMVSLLIHLGDRLGIFTTLATASAYQTTDQLATTTSYNRRWLMEWLRGMAAAKILEYGVVALSLEAVVGSRYGGGARVLR